MLELEENDPGDDYGLDACRALLDEKNPLRNYSPGPVRFLFDRRRSSESIFPPVRFNEGIKRARLPKHRCAITVANNGSSYDCRATEGTKAIPSKYI